MSTRSRASLMLGLVLMLAGGLIAPQTALAKRYSMSTEFALDASGTVSVTETTTVFHDRTGSTVQHRYWVFPSNGFSGIDVLGVFRSDGSAYRRVDTSGTPGTCIVAQDSAGVRVTVFDSGHFATLTHVLRYRLPGVVTRYFNTAVLDWWVIGTYDAPVSFTARIVPPRPLAPTAVRTSHRGPEGGTLQVTPEGAVTYEHANLPGSEGVLTRTLYSSGEFRGVPLTVGKLGLARSPSKSRVVYRRVKGTAQFKLTVKVSDSVGDPLGSTRVYLQTSKNGRTGWRDTLPLRTNAKGSASRTVRAKKAGNTYYRWYVPARANAYRKALTSKQAVVVK